MLVWQCGIGHRGTPISGIGHREGQYREGYHRGGSISGTAVWKPTKSKRMTVSKPVLEAPIVSALRNNIMFCFQVYFLHDCSLIVYRCTHGPQLPAQYRPPGKGGYASLFPHMNKCQNPPMQRYFITDCVLILYRCTRAHSTPDCLLIVYRCTRAPPPPPCHPPGRNIADCLLILYRCNRAHSTPDCLLIVYRCDRAPPPPPCHPPGRVGNALTSLTVCSYCTGAPVHIRPLTVCS